MTARCGAPTKSGLCVMIAGHRTYTQPHMRPCASAARVCAEASMLRFLATGQYVEYQLTATESTEETR